jgi:hypothetical protein
MNCGEFQKSLPNIIDGGGTPEQQAHLKACAVCSDLVQDLRYIAEQAKLLVPMHDPSPRVWAGIQGSLEREGLVRPSSAGRFQPSVMAGGARWGNFARWGAVAALALVAVWIVGTRMNEPGTQTAEVASPASDIAADADDQQLIAMVAKHAPERAEVYQRSLNDVNSYIADVKKSLAQDPGDQQAREHLMQAYEQKAMLYDIATSGPTE